MNNKVSNIDDYKDILLIFFVLLLAFLIRAILLKNYDVISSDGVVLIDICKTIKNGEFLAVNKIEHHHHPLYPALIAILSFLPFATYVQCGQIISLASGIFSIWITYKLSETLYNKKIAIWSALILSIIPIHSFYSITVLKDSLYTLNVLLLIYFLSLTTKRPKNNYFAIAGICLGCLYLVRFDGILFILIIPFIYILECKYENKEKASKLLITFIVAGLIYIIYVTLLYHQTGKLTFSKKINYYVNPLFETKLGEDKIVSQYGKRSGNKILKTNKNYRSFILKRIEGFYKNLFYHMSYVFPAILLVFIGISFGRYGLKKNEIMIIIVPVLYFSVFPLLKYPDSHRYMLCTTPFFSILAGRGIYFTENNIKQLIKNRWVRLTLH